MLLMGETLLPLPGPSVPFCRISFWRLGVHCLPLQPLDYYYRLIIFVPALSLGVPLPSVVRLLLDEFGMPPYYAVCNHLIRALPYYYRLEARLYRC